ncbi:hypothetical protein EYR41_011580 [Orbilia oligospora]|uniref:Uncharacterized protein n=1 Tax=Orbilia oligospora TaxID=2813651 RepID=A0A7C8JZZ8_ORBOL|nr:hypothetical protein TWF751_000614 [Orbilia oligospora]TGJ63684.1 hypothetical protein EYR41_011580 [Orbilia oligospora]
MFLSFAKESRIFLNINVPVRNISINHGGKLISSKLQRLKTPLSKAIEGGDDAIVELLLANGARPEVEDRHGWKPLSRAIEVGNAATVKHLLAAGIEVDYDYSITRLETRTGFRAKVIRWRNALPNKSDGAGSKPLMMAIEAENETIVEDLLGIGVEVNYTFGTSVSTTSI